LHQKTVLNDDQAALVGTANFDNRSFRLNFKITAIVVDRGFASEVEAMFEHDFSRSRLMALGEYDAKPWWFRVAVRVSRSAAPVR
jgi:cardiolipin synthase